MVYQHTQHIEGPGTDHHGLAVAEQPALMPLKNKITKGTDSGVCDSGSEVNEQCALSVFE
jgi:hypothetical protein